MAASQNVQADPYPRPTGKTTSLAMWTTVTDSGDHGPCFDGVISQLREPPPYQFIFDRTKNPGIFPESTKKNCVGSNIGQATRVKQQTFVQMYSFNIFSESNFGLKKSKAHFRWSPRFRSSAGPFVQDLGNATRWMRDLRGASDAQEGPFSGSAGISIWRGLDLISRFAEDPKDI